MKKIFVHYLPHSTSFCSRFVRNGVRFNSVYGPSFQALTLQGSHFRYARQSLIHSALSISECLNEENGQGNAKFARRGGNLHKFL